MIDVMVEEEYGYRYWVLSTSSLAGFQRWWDALESVEAGFYDPSKLFAPIGDLREAEEGEFYRRLRDGSSPLKVHVHQDDDSHTLSLPLSRDSVCNEFVYDPRRRMGQLQGNSD